MYSYTIDGQNFRAPIMGLENFEREIFRDKSLNSDGVISVRSNSSVTFTGDAFDYICDKMYNDGCVDFVFEVDDLDYVAVFNSFMVTINHSRKIASTQLKETDWAIILRNRAKVEVSVIDWYPWNLTYNGVTAMPLIPDVRRSYSCFNGNGQMYLYEPTPGVYEQSRAPGRRVYAILDYLITYLSDTNLELESNFFLNNTYSIFIGTALSERQFFYPYITSFDKLIEQLMKIFNLSINIEGNKVIIEPDQEFYQDSVHESMVVPFDMETIIDNERSFSTVEVGGDIIKIDPEDVDADNYLTYPQDDYVAFNQNTYNGCSCNDEKENTLDLKFDFIVDSASILKQLDDVDSDSDKLFLIEVDESVFPPRLVRYYNPDTTIYYNQQLLNVNILRRWEDKTSICFTKFVNTGQFFLSDCTAGGSCNPTVITMDTPEPGYTYTNHFEFKNPDGESEPNIDKYGSWNDDPIGNISVAYPYTSFRVRVPLEYVFRVKCRVQFDLGSTPLNGLQIFVGAMIYESAASPVLDILGETFDYGSHTGAFDETFEVTTGDPVFLDVDYYVVPAVYIGVYGDNTDIQFTGANPLILTPISFGLDVEAMQRASSENKEKFDFVHTFTKEMCLDDFNSLITNKTKAIEIGGVKAWINSVKWNNKGFAEYEMMSREMIACGCDMREDLEESEYLPCVDESECESEWDCEGDPCPEGYYVCLPPQPTNESGTLYLYADDEAFTYDVVGGGDFDILVSFFDNSKKNGCQYVDVSKQFNMPSGSTFDDIADELVNTIIPSIISDFNNLGYTSGVTYGISTRNGKRTLWLKTGGSDTIYFDFIINYSLSNSFTNPISNNMQYDRAWANNENIFVSKVSGNPNTDGITMEVSDLYYGFDNYVEITPCDELSGKYCVASNEDFTLTFSWLLQDPTAPPYDILTPIQEEP